MLVLKDKHEHAECSQYSIVVDENLKLVYDAAEKYELVLEGNIIHSCVRDGFNLVEITDLRNVITQQKESANSKIRRSLHGMKKRKQEKRGS